MEIGTVISTMDGPSPNTFSFVVDEKNGEMPVQKNQFVELKTPQGNMVAMVQDIIKTNRYFERAESVREYERSGNSMSTIFPVERWEYLVSLAQPLGVYTDKGLKRATFPPSPGTKVFAIENKTLKDFLGLTDDGIELGKVDHHELPVKLDLTRMVQKHWAMLGISGSGKCIPYGSQIALATGETIPIGKLADKEFEKAKLIYNDGDTEYICPQKLEVLSIDQNLKIKHSKVRALTRRKSPKKLLKLRTTQGREITLTKEHPLYVLEGSLPQWKKAGELKMGDHIATPRRLYVNSKEQVIDLVEMLKDERDVYGIIDLRKHLKPLRTRGLCYSDVANTLKIPKTTLNFYLATFQFPLRYLTFLRNLYGLRFKVDKIKWKRGDPINSKLTLSKDFVRLLAYLHGEGHNNLQALTFSNNNTGIQQDYINLCKAFFGKSATYGKDIRVHSRLFAKILQKFGVETSAATKKIPPQIMNSPNEHISIFLRTMFDCDGYVCKSKPELEFATASKDFAHKIPTLLLRFGITCRIKERMQKVTNGKKKYYYLYISQNENIRRFRDHIGFTIGYKKETLEKWYNTTGNPNIDLVPNTGELIQELLKKLRLYSTRIPGVMESSIINYIQKRRSPSRQTLLKIADAFEDRREALLETGREIYKLEMPPDPNQILEDVQVQHEHTDLQFKEIAPYTTTSASTVRRMIRGITGPTDHIYEISDAFSALSGKKRHFTHLQNHYKQNLVHKLSSICRTLSLSYPELSSHADLYSTAFTAYARNRSTPSLGDLRNLVIGLKMWWNEIESDLADSEELIKRLKNLAESDIFWDVVKEITEVPANSEYVYDLSIDAVHNFVAGHGNIIIHNSYATSVVLEELLERKPENGRVALFIIDTHGEYTGFAETYPDKVKVIRGNDIRIGTSNLYASAFAALLPEMSSTQKRDLNRILEKLKKQKKKEGKPYNLCDVTKAIEEDGEIKENTVGPLIGWINELKFLKLFNYSDYPATSELEQAQALILDLSDITYLRKKQTIVSYFSRQLFDMRRKGLVPPYVEIIEEAHQFAPETASKENNIAGSILKTIAREGRKFYASLCLISQRPIQLSTTILSQCNTQLIFRITNPYDLDHIGKSSEGISRSTLDTISSLRVGEGLIVGEAVNFPVFVAVRERRSKPPSHSTKLQDYAIKYEKTMSQKGEDIKAFM